MGHVFTKTALQDTVILCSNEVVVPSSCWLISLRYRESKNAAHSQKSSRQTGAERSTCKKPLKSKATATPLPYAHTLASALGYHSRNHSVSGVERKRRGKEAVPGIMAFNRADSQLFCSC